MRACTCRATDRSGAWAREASQRASRAREAAAEVARTRTSQEARPPSAMTRADQARQRRVSLLSPCTQLRASSSSHPRLTSRARFSGSKAGLGSAGRVFYNAMPPPPGLYGASASAATPGNPGNPGSRPATVAPGGGGGGGGGGGRGLAGGGRGPAGGGRGPAGGRGGRGGGWQQQQQGGGGGRGPAAGPYRSGGGGFSAPAPQYNIHGLANQFVHVSSPAGCSRRPAATLQIPARSVPHSPPFPLSPPLPSPPPVTSLSRYLHSCFLTRSPHFFPSRPLSSFLHSAGRV
jgi:hypothetical protein